MRKTRSTRRAAFGTPGHKWAHNQKMMRPLTVEQLKRVTRRRRRNKAAKLSRRRNRP